MTVKELREKLSDFSDDLEIWDYYGGGRIGEKFFTLRSIDVYEHKLPIGSEWLTFCDDRVVKEKKVLQL